MTALNTIDNNRISPNALKVIKRLESEGYSAYLVGGGVRDLLLGKHPKDFDISTDARPEQIRQLFRNSRIIGRRFRIVHVLYGREIIEVTTFRGHHPEADPESPNRHAAISESGRLLRDNVYGSIEEDALRRDFTVNALYYQPSNGEIMDFCGGLDDLRAQRLKMIGDPQRRYREDPVRLLRAVRFKAKHDLELSQDTAQPIDELASLLHDIPPARMFDEVLKLFMSGVALDTYRELQKHQLFGYLFPSCQRIIHQDDQISVAFIEKMLRNTDARIHQGKPVTPAFLYGALLWPAVRQQTQALIKQGLPPIPARQQAGITSIEHQIQYISIPRRFSTVMREIWDLQYRLEQPRGSKADELLSLQRFRAAYDFLLLREESGEETGGMGAWWTQYQEANPETKDALKKKVQTRSPSRRKRRKSPRKQAKKLSDQVP